MPIALLVLIYAAFIPYLLALLGGYLKIAHFGYLDNKHPRLQEKQLQSSPAARVVAAQANAWEALGLYSATLLVVYANSVPWDSVSVPAVVFGITRILHPLFYCADLATLRSMSVLVGVASCGYMVFLGVSVS